MSLMRNHPYWLFAIAAAIVFACYLCTVSVVWAMTLCIIAPMLLGYALRRLTDDHDYSDEFEDADWRKD